MERSEDNWTPEKVFGTEELLVATPSSSWTLLDSSTVLESAEVMSLEDDDDGLADEEERLERVSERLEALEREVPALRNLATVEDVAAADAAAAAAEAKAAEAKRVLQKSSRAPSRESSPVPTRTRRVIVVVLVVATLGVLTAMAASRLAQRPVELAEPLDVPEQFSQAQQFPEPPRPAFAEFEDPVLPGAPPIFDLDSAIAAARDHVEHVLVEDGGLKVLCSVGLGALGLAVGVPYVPGITDNLFVGIAAAALPLLTRGAPAASDHQDAAAGSL